MKKSILTTVIIAMFSMLAFSQNPILISGSNIINTDSNLTLAGETILKYTYTFK